MIISYSTINHSLILLILLKKLLFYLECIFFLFFVYNTLIRKYSNLFAFIFNHVSIGGQMNKKVLLISMVAAAACSTAFGVDNTLANLQAINTQVQASVQVGVGGWMKAFMGWVPLALFFGMMIGTLFYNLKKSEQSQENDYMKIGLWTFAFGFMGGVFGYAIDSFIGASMLGNAACGTEVFTNYWKESLGMVQIGTADYNCM